MIEKLINTLNSYIESLKSSMIFSEKELSNYLKVANSINNNEVLSKEDLALVLKNSSFTDEEKTKLEFIFVLFKISSDIKLDEKQVEVYNRFKEFINNKIEELNNNTDKLLIDEINQLISDLQSNSTFKSFDELNNIFKKVQMPMSDRLEIVKELIMSNYNKNEYEEEIAIYNNEDESIIKIFEAYGLDYSLLKEEYKSILKKYADLKVLDEVLASLMELDKEIVHKLMKKNQELFTKILINCNKDILNDIISISNDNKLDAIKFISKHPNILIPNKTKGLKIFKKQSSGKSTKEGLNGAFNNFKENIEFFRSEGIDVSVLQEKCLTVLVKSSDIIKANYQILKELYNIPLNEKESMVCLSLGTSLSYLDTLIEVDEYGYEYAKNNQSILFNGKEILLYKLKIKDLYHQDEQVKEKVDSSSLYEYPADPIFYTKNDRIRRNLKVYADGPNEVEEAREIIELPTIDVDDKFELLTMSLLPKIKSINISDLITNKYIESLENNYKKNDYVYSINNTRISRIKFLRICTLFKMQNIELDINAIMYALTYNSLMIQSDLNNINEFINSLSFARNGGAN